MDTDLQQDLPLRDRKRRRGRLPVPAGGTHGLPQLSLGETWILLIVIGHGTARVVEQHLDNARHLVEHRMLVEVTTHPGVFQGTLRGARAITLMRPLDAAVGRSYGAPLASQVQLKR